VKLNELFSHWDEIHKGTLYLIDCFTEEEISHRLFDGGWSLGEIALHIANAEEGWFRVVAAKKDDDWPANHTLENYPSWDAIHNLLKETHQKTMAYLRTMTINDLDMVVDSKWGEFSLQFIVWHVIEHEVHHRGELSIILGTLGRGGLNV